MSTLNVANIQSLTTSTLPVVKNSAGTEVGRYVRAFVRFNGSGTPSINSSFNVSSITDSGTGHYIVNMSITMASIDFAAFADGRFNLSDGDVSANLTLRRLAQTTTSYGIRCSDASANVYNPTFVTGVVFGD